MTRRTSTILLAAAAWTAFIWLFRFRNMLGEDHSAGFLVVHGVIATVSLGFAAALAVIGLRVRRATARPDPVRR